jgi:hypothetical protein
MSTLGIRQRLLELKAGIAAIGAKIRTSSDDEPAPTRSDEPKSTDRAAIADSALGDAYPYVVRRPRPSRYY